MVREGVKVVQIVPPQRAPELGVPKVIASGTALTNLEKCDEASLADRRTTQAGQVLSEVPGKDILAPSG